MNHNNDRTGAAWTYVIGAWVILFMGEPDLLDALISYLMK